MSALAIEPILTVEVLKALLRYVPEKGILIWKKTKGKILGGTQAGSVSKKSGYHSIYINGKNYYTHRLIWMYETGQMPINDIDHKDRDKSNNLFSNLRDVSRSDNLMNTGIRKDNTSGVKGVHWYKSKSKWQVKVKNKHIGYFESLDDAIAARTEALR